jgi:hypothetical protein
VTAGGLAAFVAWLEQAPAGTTLDARAVLDAVRQAAAPASLPAEAPPPAALTWRERLWTVPPETRLGVLEVAEALGRPKSWVHRRTSPASGLAQLPHRKLDAALVFLAGEVRTWVAEHEEIIVGAPRDTRALMLHPRTRTG